MRTEASGTANMWAADNSKFYVIAERGVTLVYSFNPSTMHIGSLPGAKPGLGFHVPLRIGGSFSFTDPDLMYGIAPGRELTISSYRFSTGKVSTILDTTKCGTQPPLVRTPNVRTDDDVTPTLDGSRISVSEGGLQPSENMFVVVTTRGWDVGGTTRKPGRLADSGDQQVPLPFQILILLDMHTCRAAASMSESQYRARVGTCGMWPR